MIDTSAVLQKIMLNKFIKPNPEILTEIVLKQSAYNGQCEYDGNILHVEHYF